MIFEKLQEFPLVISWLGTGVERVLRMNSSEPMIGWRGEHLVSWLSINCNR
jgi:hypothetical protein